MTKFIKNIYRIVKNKYTISIGIISSYIFGAKISDVEFLSKAFNSEYQFQNQEHVYEHFLKRKKPVFFIDSSQTEEIKNALHVNFPNASDEIIAHADKICRHEFNLLGSGDVKLGDKIDWHRDFKTGYSWKANKYYKEIKVPLGKADIKVPRELSRFQHFATLGEAYLLTQDDKYVKEFIGQITSWIDNNKPKFGVNWTCSMDVSIRACNWILGYYFLKDSSAISKEFLLKFLKSLYQHGKHIISNLENTALFTTNHYLSDIVGLIYLGLIFPEFKNAITWREFGIRGLIKEMEKQVYPDGVHYEGSTYYHRLTTELFLFVTILCLKNKVILPERYMERLKKMIEFVMFYTKPDGNAPQIGDNDNGRLHILSNDNGNSKFDHRYLLSIGAVIFNHSVFKKECGGFQEEAFWLLSVDGLMKFNTIPVNNGNLLSKAFPLGGYYVITDKESYMIIDCIPGGNAPSGHKHNSRLSFELYSYGRNIIVDPGAYIYTASPYWRDKFRSTGYHNTVKFKKYEQNEFLKGNMFGFKERVEILNADLKETEDKVTFQGEIKYLNFLHKRTINLLKRTCAWQIIDSVSIFEPTSLKIIFHLSPDVYYNEGFICIKDSREKLASIIIEGHKIKKENYNYSSEYGVKVEAESLIADVFVTERTNNIVTYIKKAN